MLPRISQCWISSISIDWNSRDFLVNLFEHEASLMVTSSLPYVDLEIIELQIVFHLLSSPCTFNSLAPFALQLSIR